MVPGSQAVVCHTGQAAADQAAFLEMANAALNGSDLPSNVSDFLQSVQVEPELEAALPPENDATGSQEQAGNAYFLISAAQACRRVHCTDTAQYHHGADVSFSSVSWQYAYGVSQNSAHQVSRYQQACAHSKRSCSVDDLTGPALFAWALQHAKGAARQMSSTDSHAACKIALPSLARASKSCSHAYLYRWYAKSPRPAKERLGWASKRHAPPPTNGSWAGYASPGNARSRSEFKAGAEAIAG